MSNSIRFLHIRRLTTIQVDPANNPNIMRDVPLVKGGKTIAYYVNDGVISYSVARCANKENFCRRTGRNVASGRFAAGQFKTLPLVTEDGVIEQLINVELEEGYHVG